jgi:ligand-binding sensor domain-containing protein
MDSLHCLFFEDDKYLWVGAEHELTRMDRRTGLFTTFRNNNSDSESISNASVFSIIKDKSGYVWIGTSRGVNRFDHQTGKFKRYLENNSVKSVFIDAKGILWVGSSQELLFYEPDKDRFKSYTSPNFPKGIERILGIIEDNEQNLWITTHVSIIKLNPTRDEAKLYNAEYGIQSSSWNWLDNYKAPDGRLFFGGSSGYYMIDPKELNDNRTPPLLNFTSLKIGDKIVVPKEGNVLKQALWNTDKVTFYHYQNTFTFEFEAIDFKSSGDINYLYQLENFDKEWRNLGK